ncbi:hypothetical protein ACWGH4_20605 [Streptomyces sp. NPDC054847]
MGDSDAASAEGTVRWTAACGGAGGSLPARFRELVGARATACLRSDLQQSGQGARVVEGGVGGSTPLR